MTGRWQSKIGCQVLGLHPEAKYRIRTEDLLAKPCSLCDAPLPAVRVFLGQIVVEVDRWLPGLDVLPFDAGKVKALRRVIKHRQEMLHL